MNLTEALNFVDGVASDNRDIRTYLSNGRIVFDGGRWGAADIDIASSSLDRAKAHFDNYCGNNDCKVVPRSWAPMRFGAVNMLPPEGRFRAFWGARAILDGSIIDLLHDRQYMQGAPEDRRELARRLTGSPRGHGSDGLLAHVRSVVHALMTHDQMTPRDWQPFLLAERDDVRVWGNTNASYGYLYLLAYWGEGEPRPTDPPTLKCQYDFDHEDCPIVRLEA